MSPRIEAHRSGSRWPALVTMIVVALVAITAGSGTFAAFTTITDNPGDRIESGSVSIAGNGLGAAMFSVTGMKPSDPPVERCIKVTYSGSLDADVKLYTPSAIGALGQYLNLEIRPGTGNPDFPGCAGFTADAGDIFNGTLAGFQSSHSNWATGLVDNPGSATKWVTNDAVVYRFRISLQQNSAAQGLATGSFAIRWEAQNQ